MLTFSNQSLVLYFCYRVKDLENREKARKSPRAIKKKRKYFPKKVHDLHSHDIALVELLPIVGLYYKVVCSIRVVSRVQNLLLCINLRRQQRKKE